MFETFAGIEVDRGLRQRYAISFAASAVIYAGLGGLALLSAGRAVAPVAEKIVEVAFAPPPAPAPPVAPPPPSRAPKPPIVRGLAPPAQALVAPRDMPTELPTEPAPTAGSGEGDGFGTEGGIAAEPAAPTEPAPVVRRAPMNLPEEAEPPVADAANAMPTFPEAARSSGKEGQVILKVVIDEHGRVESIEVLRGEEPFVDAALTVVRNWRYSPARLGGQAIPVFRIIKIPFRLSVGSL